jgi:hypothetical protein
MHLTLGKRQKKLSQLWIEGLEHCWRRGFDHWLLFCVFFFFVCICGSCWVWPGREKCFAVWSLDCGFGVGVVEEETQECHQGQHGITQSHSPHAKKKPGGPRHRNIKCNFAPPTFNHNLGSHRLRENSILRRKTKGSRVRGLNNLKKRLQTNLSY